MHKISALAASGDGPWLPYQELLGGHAPDPARVVASLRGQSLVGHAVTMAACANSGMKLSKEVMQAWGGALLPLLLQDTAVQPAGRGDAAGRAGRGVAGGLQGEGLWRMVDQHHHSSDVEKQRAALRQHGDVPGQQGIAAGQQADAMRQSQQRRWQRQQQPEENQQGWPVRHASHQAEPLPDRDVLTVRQIRQLACLLSLTQSMGTLHRHCGLLPMSVLMLRLQQHMHHMGPMQLVMLAEALANMDYFPYTAPACRLGNELGLRAAWQQPDMAWQHHPEQGRSTMQQGNLWQQQDVAHSGHMAWQQGQLIQDGNAGTEPGQSAAGPAIPEEPAASAATGAAGRTERPGQELLHPQQQQPEPQLLQPQQPQPEPQLLQPQQPQPLQPQQQQQSQQTQQLHAVPPAWLSQPPHSWMTELLLCVMDCLDGFTGQQVCALLKSLARLDLHPWAARAPHLRLQLRLAAAVATREDWQAELTSEMLPKPRPITTSTHTHPRPATRAATPVIFGAQQQQQHTLPTDSDSYLQHQQQQTPSTVEPTQPVQQAAGHTHTASTTPTTTNDLTPTGPMLQVSAWVPAAGHQQASPLAAGHQQASSSPSATPRRRLFAPLPARSTEADPWDDVPPPLVAARRLLCPSASAIPEATDLPPGVAARRLLFPPAAAPPPDQHQEAPLPEATEPLTVDPHAAPFPPSTATWHDSLAPSPPTPASATWPEGSAPPLAPANTWPEGLAAPLPPAAMGPEGPPSARPRSTRPAAVASEATEGGHSSSRQAGPMRFELFRPEEVQIGLWSLLHLSTPVMKRWLWLLLVSAARHANSLTPRGLVAVFRVMAEYRCALPLGGPVLQQLWDAVHYHYHWRHFSPSDLASLLWYAHHANRPPPAWALGYSLEHFTARALLQLQPGEPSLQPQLVPQHEQQGALDAVGPQPPASLQQTLDDEVMQPWTSLGLPLHATASAAQPQMLRSNDNVQPTDTDRQSGYASPQAGAGVPAAAAAPPLPAGGTVKAVQSPLPAGGTVKALQVTQLLTVVAAAGQAVPPAQALPLAAMLARGLRQLPPSLVAHGLWALAECAPGLLTPQPNHHHCAATMAAAMHRSDVTTAMEAADSGPVSRVQVERQLCQGMSAALPALLSAGSGQQCARVAWALQVLGLGQSTVGITTRLVLRACESNGSTSTSNTSGTSSTSRASTSTSNTSSTSSTNTNSSATMSSSYTPAEYMASQGTAASEAATNFPLQSSSTRSEAALGAQPEATAGVKTGRKGSSARQGALSATEAAMVVCVVRRLPLCNAGSHAIRAGKQRQQARLAAADGAAARSTGQGFDGSHSSNNRPGNTTSGSNDSDPTSTTNSHATTTGTPSGSDSPPPSELLLQSLPGLVASVQATHPQALCLTHPLLLPEYISALAKLKLAKKVDINWWAQACELVHAQAAAGALPVTALLALLSAAARGKGRAGAQGAGAKAGVFDAGLDVGVLVRALKVCMERARQQELAAQRSAVTGAPGVAGGRAEAVSKAGERAGDRPGLAGGAAGVLPSAMHWELHAAVLSDVLSACVRGEVILDDDTYAILCRSIAARTAELKPGDLVGVVSGLAHTSRLRGNNLTGAMPANTATTTGSPCSMVGVVSDLAHTSRLRGNSLTSAVPGSAATTTGNFAATTGSHRHMPAQVRDPAAAAAAPRTAAPNQAACTAIDPAWPVLQAVLAVPVSRLVMTRDSAPTAAPTASAPAAPTPAAPAPARPPGLHLEVLLPASAVSGDAGVGEVVYALGPDQPSGGRGASAAAPTTAPWLAGSPATAPWLAGALPAAPWPAGGPVDVGDVVCALSPDQMGNLLLGLAEWRVDLDGSWLHAYLSLLQVRAPQHMSHVGIRNCIKALVTLRHWPGAEFVTCLQEQLTWCFGRRNLGPSELTLLQSQLSDLHPLARPATNATPAAALAPPMAAPTAASTAASGLLKHILPYPGASQHTTRLGPLGPSKTLGSAPALVPLGTSIPPRARRQQPTQPPPLDSVASRVLRSLYFSKLQGSLQMLARAAFGGLGEGERDEDGAPKGGRETGRAATPGGGAGQLRRLGLSQASAGRSSQSQPLASHSYSRGVRGEREGALGRLLPVGSVGRMQRDAGEEEQGQGSRVVDGGREQGVAPLVATLHVQLSHTVLPRPRPAGPEQGVASMVANLHVQLGAGREQGVTPMVASLHAQLSRTLALLATARGVGVAAHSGVVDQEDQEGV